MSLVRCGNVYCPHYVREGLKRDGKDDRGKELADGRFCWRCRQGRMAHLLKTPRTWHSK